MSKNVLVGFSAIAATFFSTGAVAHERSQPAVINLSISVFNDASVSPSVLAQAQDTSAFVMRQAGISVSWLDCGAPGISPAAAGCSAISFPQHFSIRLVSKATPAKEDIFGQSFQNDAGEGSYAIVYFPGLASFRTTEIIHTGDLLGLVMAHELGHLLLGKNSHSATGLMCGNWRQPELHQAARGKLLFTQQQSSLIRSRYLAVTARLQAAQNLQTSSGK
ncbi:MAG TPA: hypothetical protein VIW23_08485 [Candidatus Acidoferrum sp.]|jgi:hypothetical protein